MPAEALSLTRRFLLWFMEYPPYSPYVSVACSLDLSRGRAYLEALRQEHAVAASITHLVTAAVAKVYVEFPMANASVVGRRILRHPHVGAVMPVNTLDRGRTEVGVVLTEKVETLSLRALAESHRRQVHAERGGSSENAVLRWILPLAEHAPDALFRGGLDALSKVLKRPTVAARIHRRFPATVVISNAGAAIPLPGGALTRAASFSPPDRLIAIGTLFAIFPVQDEVIAVDGRPEVRPMLPITYTFDHRLFDGVMSGRILHRLAEILRDPAAAFGPGGEAIIGG